MDDQKARQYLASALGWALNALETVPTVDPQKMKASKEILSTCKPETQQEWWQNWNQDKREEFSGKL